MVFSKSERDPTAKGLDLVGYTEPLFQLSLTEEVVETTANVMSESMMTESWKCSSFCNAGLTSCSEQFILVKKLTSPSTRWRWPILLLAHLAESLLSSPSLPCKCLNFATESLDECEGLSCCLTYIYQHLQFSYIRGTPKVLYCNALLLFQL